MRIVLVVIALAALALAGPASGVNTSRSAEAAVVTLQLQLTGAQEMLPVVSHGSAQARLVYDSDAKTISYTVTVNGMQLGAVTAAHFHRGAAGVNGPVVHAISTVPFIHAAGTWMLTDEDVADLVAGRIYINVHSQEHPGGFARAQVIVPASAAPSAPTAAPAAPSITPPTTGDAGLLANKAAGWTTFGWTALAIVLLTGGAALALRRA